MTETVRRARRRGWVWLVLVLSVVGAAATIAGAAWAWAQPLARLNRDDARLFTAGALDAAGFDDVAVATEVAAGVYPDQPSDAGEFQVWITSAVTQGQTVRFWINREAPQALQIDDNTAEGTTLLTDDQFQAVDSYDEHPRAEERLRRNLIATAAAVMGVTVAVVLIAACRSLLSRLDRR
ncbi:MAG: hypothetical protein ACRD29_23005 [Acidimicrobiales bacterium]